MKFLPKVVLFIDTSRACGQQILKGIAAYCNYFEPWRLSQKPPSYLESGNYDLSCPENWLGDGLFISEKVVPKAILDIGIPMIGIDVRQEIPDMPNIIGDDVAIAKLAASHFWERGFTNFAYFGLKDIDWSTRREQAFSRVIHEHNYECHCYRRQEEARLSWDDELFSMAEWLSNLPKPLAVFSGNDDLCKLVNQACQLGNLQVPNEVALLGVDNDEMVCLPSDPPLSSIAINFEKVGFEAARLLSQLIHKTEKPKNQRLILQPLYVVERQSTNVLAISDKEVSNALSFMRINFNKAITVDDVVESTALSRRSLEKRFRDQLQCSINAELRKIRVGYIKKMLNNTNLTLAQIASNVQYTDPEHLARYFRQEMGVSPSEYRKQITIHL